MWSVAMTGEVSEHGRAFEGCAAKSRGEAMSLRGTRISEKGIERLRARLPNCEIVFSTESAEESTTDDEG